MNNMCATSSLNYRQRLLSAESSDTSTEGYNSEEGGENGVVEMLGIGQRV